METNSNTYLVEFNLSDIDDNKLFVLKDGYKINNDNTSLINRITINHTLLDNNKTHLINVFLLIKSNIKSLVCSFDDNDCQVSKAKTYNPNQTVENYIMKNNVILIKLLTVDKSINYFLFVTEREIYLHSIHDIKNCKLLMNFDNLGEIKDVFVNDANSKTMIILVENNILIEIEINYNDLPQFTNHINSIVDYFKSGKLDKSKYNLSKFNSSIIRSLSYKVIEPLDSKSLFKSIIIFEKDIVPINIIFRPLDKGNFVVSFQNAIAGVFDLKTKGLVCVYKTMFGNIISMNYSFDGRLLALGCEDDNAYIIDAERNALLYSLQGHNNYVSSLVFTEKVEEEIETNTKTRSNNLFSSNKSNIKSKEMKIYTEEIDLNELLSNYDNLKTQDKTNLTNNQIQNITAGSIIAPRKSKIVSNKNLVFIMNDSPKRKKTIMTYLLYSSSFDGTIATWQIDNIIDKEYINKNNYFPRESVKEENSIDSNLKTVLLDISKNNTIRSLSIIKVCNAQIYNLYVNDNFLLYLAKMNNHITDIYFRMFYASQVKEIKSIESKIDDTLDKSVSASQQSSAVKIKRDRK